MSLWLTPEEIEFRTGKKWRKLQCAELARQGVKFKVRWDGFPLVDRAQFEGQPEQKPSRRKEPNYAAWRSS